jgi:hypothetical protein
MTPTCIAQAGTLRGDGLDAFDDRFTFASYSFQGKLIYSLLAVQPLYCQYLCTYDAIHSVYEDGQGEPVVVIRDRITTRPAPDRKLIRYGPSVCDAERAEELLKEWLLHDADQPLLFQAVPILAAA